MEGGILTLQSPIFEKNNSKITGSDPGVVYVEGLFILNLLGRKFLPNSTRNNIIWVIGNALFMSNEPT